jgi:hypothetical protein
LRALVSAHGEGDWYAIAAGIPGRTPRQCRDRWTNCLSPTLNHDAWTPEEDRLLAEMHRELGPQWVRIARCFKNRTDGMVKNRFRLLRRHKCKERELQESHGPLLLMMLLKIEIKERAAEKEKPVFGPILARFETEEECDAWQGELESDLEGCAD